MIDSEVDTNLQVNEMNYKKKKKKNPLFLLPRMFSWPQATI